MGGIIWKYSDLNDLSRFCAPMRTQMLLEGKYNSVVKRESKVISINKARQVRELELKTLLETGDYLDLGHT